MYRNLNTDLSKSPHLKKSRSLIPINTGRATTANAGDLVPFFWTEVLAGGTYSMDTAFVARMTPSINPTMANAFLDYFYFFVPNRIMWNKWKNFFGEPESYWTPTQNYHVPQISFPVGGFSVGSVADHLGLPTQTSYNGNIVASASGLPGDMDTVSILPILAYLHVYNEWFRSENLQDPAYCPVSFPGDIQGWKIGDTSEISNPLESALHGARLLKASKPFDLFTGALPSPQRGPEVSIPVSTSGTFPVITGPERTVSSLEPPLKFNGPFGTIPINMGTPAYIAGTGSYNGIVADADYASWSPLSDNVAAPQWLKTTNQYAQADRATAATLNDLRYAFALQHLYEDLARHGARYREILHGIFGVTNPNPTEDIPEYLGGGRTEINMSTVIQSARLTSSGPLGATAGYSHTSGSGHSYTFSADEPGILIGVFTIRNPKTYAQGLNKMWLRKDRFDYYWPEFANIGEVGVPKGTLFLTNDGENEEIFGYQEAWYEYRQIPYEVSGLFRPGVSGSLSSWNYADFYTSRPVLSDEWIEDNSKANLDRTLATPSNLAGCQFLIDIALKGTHVLPMPVYSIPGLTRL